MAGRSPARFLAPLALVAFGIALVIVINNSRGDGGGTEPNRATDNRPAASPSEGNGKPKRKVKRRYTVKPGDTPSAIAEKTGVPLEEILRLNPNLDPQTLAPGQQIRLRQ